MKLFRLDASIRVDGSVTRTLADVVEQEWHREHPDSTVIRRDLGRDPLPSRWLDAMGGALPGVAHPPTDADHSTALALGTQLADELVEADAYVFAVPMYNFGVPQDVKNWIDLLMTDPRGLSLGQTVGGRPGVLIAALGGGYSPGTPREGWNHLTPYLQTVLGKHLGLDLLTVEVELTLADVNPAMAELRGMAAELLQAAHGSAREHGMTIAHRLRAAA